MGNHILQLENLSKSFGSHRVINNVSLNVGAGDIFGFLGPNGAGKTTIIRIALGLIRADCGRIFLNGYDIKTAFLRAIARVGAVVEVPRFHENLSAYKNLLLTANLHTHIAKTRIDEVLEMVGLTSRAQSMVGSYSLGMKQRLGIARALINDPLLVFLDEPMNGLDPQGMKEIRLLLKHLSTTKGVTFFLTSHLLHEIEQSCNKVAILKEGRILEQGLVEDLLFTDTEVIQVYTPQAREAGALLAPLNYIRNHRLQEDGLIIEVDKGTSGLLNAFLIDRQIEIKYLVPKNQSLEDYFLTLMGEAGDLAKTRSK